MLKILDKKCPACRSRFSFRRYIGTFSRTYRCKECGEYFSGGGFGNSLLGAGLGSLFISLPLIQAWNDARWAWALIPGLFLSAVWGYLILRPQASGGTKRQREGVDA